MSLIYTIHYCKYTARRSSVAGLLVAATLHLYRLQRFDLGLYLAQVHLRVIQRHTALAPHLSLVA
jgi:hypothetical protein